MVEDLSKHGRLDHLLPDLPGELVPTYAQLLEAEVPEVLARRLVRHVADRLEPDEVHRPEAVRDALRDAVESCVPIAPPIAAVAGDAAGRGPGRPDGRRQDDDRRQARGQLQARARLPARPGHGRHVPDRRRRAAPDLCRDHRPAPGRGQRAGRDAAGDRRAGGRGPRPDRHRRAQPARRGQDPRAGRTSWPRRGPTRSTWSSAPWPASGASARRSSGSRWSTPTA